MRATAVAALLALVATASATAADPADAAGAPGCRFERPAGWTETTLRWTGDCAGGHAQGLGVLRAYSGTLASRLFFGRLQGGRLDIGVVELPEGYQAGRFDAGQLQRSDERSVVLQAFEQAQAAARAAAARFRQAGNEASARFYDDKARQLGQQMD